MQRPVSAVTGFVLAICQRSAVGLGNRTAVEPVSPHLDMNHALVLACGNPLRGDDGVAVVLARYFRAEFCEPETDIRSSQQWTPDLAEQISQSDTVLFLDASATVPPGKVEFKKLEPAREFSSSTTHTMSPEALLALAAQVYSRRPERAFLLTIGGESFDHADQLSELVRSAIPVALNLIKAALSGVSVPEMDFHGVNDAT